ncbi:MAG: hypothetical protein M5R42_05550 [Rhodocyclaceae bacterium]|nr:hypothetical protein [Rhodocyclaceae bacterium]
MPLRVGLAGRHAGQQFDSPSRHLRRSLYARNLPSAQAAATSSRSIGA